MLENPVYRILIEQQILLFKSNLFLHFIFPDSIVVLFTYLGEFAFISILLLSFFFFEKKTKTNAEF